MKASNNWSLWRGTEFMPFRQYQYQQSALPSRREANEPHLQQLTRREYEPWQQN